MSERCICGAYLRKITWAKWECRRCRRQYERKHGKSKVFKVKRDQA